MCIILLYEIHTHTTSVNFLALAGSTAMAVSCRKWEFIRSGQPADNRLCRYTRDHRRPDRYFRDNTRNRTDKTVNIPYETGQQWDMAVYHDRTQIFRWSQRPYLGRCSAISIPLKTGETRSQQLS